MQVFSCAFKHEVLMNYNERLEKEIKVLSDKNHALEKIIVTKGKMMDEVTVNSLRSQIEV